MCHLYRFYAHSLRVQCDLNLLAGVMVHARNTLFCHGDHLCHCSLTIVQSYVEDGGGERLEMQTYFYYTQTQIKYIGTQILGVSNFCL